MKINMATLDEIEATNIARTIATLHVASWRASYRGILTDDYLDYQVEADRLHHWQAHVPELKSGLGEIYMATLESAPVGFVCIEIDPEQDLGAYVDNLHVLPQAQGQGIGTLLLTAAGCWAQKHGASKLHLHVYEDNLPARQFYARDGWHTVAREIYDLPGGGQAAALTLTKKLS